MRSVGGREDRGETIREKDPVATEKTGTSVEVREEVSVDAVETENDLFDV